MAQRERREGLLLAIKCLPSTFKLAVLGTNLGVGQALSSK